MKPGYFIIIVLLMLLSTLLACQLVMAAHRAQVAEENKPAHPCSCATCVEFHYENFLQADNVKAQ